MHPWKHGVICDPGNEKGTVRFGASCSIYVRSIEVQQARIKEGEFYRAFLEKLEKL